MKVGKDKKYDNLINIMFLEYHNRQHVPLVNLKMVKFNNKLFLGIFQVNV